MKNVAVYKDKSKEAYLTQPFSNNHQAIDIAQGYGSEIVSLGKGTITQAGFWSGYGNFVEIQHSSKIFSRYGHLSEILVSQGQKVKKGQVIGKEGSTGYSTGSHLHLEVIINGTNVNPLEYATGQKKIDTDYTPIVWIVLVILILIYLYFYEK